MKSLKLNQLQSSLLTQRQMKVVNGGVATPVICGCGCCYAGSGGSSTNSNGVANHDGGGLFSQNCEVTYYMW